MISKPYFLFPRTEIKSIPGLFIDISFESSELQGHPEQ